MSKEWEWITLNEITKNSRGEESSQSPDKPSLKTNITHEKIPSHINDTNTTENIKYHDIPDVPIVNNFNDENDTNTTENIKYLDIPEKIFCKGS